MQVTHLGRDDAQGILRDLLAAQGHDWAKLRQRALKKNPTPQRSALLHSPVRLQGLHLAQLQANSKTGKNCNHGSSETLPLHSSSLPADALLPTSTSMATFKTTCDWGNPALYGLPSKPEHGLAGLGMSVLPHSRLLLSNRPHFAGTCHACQ